MSILKHVGFLFEEVIAVKKVVLITKINKNH